MSVLTSNVQFKETEVKGHMHYTVVTFTYRGRNYAAEVHHNTNNDAVVISDMHNPSNFNALKTPKKQDIEQELIEEYRIHISNKQSTITVGSISKFSVLGHDNIESEAAGKYIVHRVEFEYEGNMYDGNIITTAKGTTSFSYMIKKESKFRSTLATMDKVRHEVRQAFELSQLSEATAGHEELTVVKEDTMQLTSPQEQAAQVANVTLSAIVLRELEQDYGITSDTCVGPRCEELVVFSKNEHQYVIPAHCLPERPDYYKQTIIKHFEYINSNDTDELIKRFEKYTGLTIVKLRNVSNEPVHFIAHGNDYILINIEWITNMDRRVYDIVRRNFKKRMITENLLQRIDSIHRMLWNAGYDTSTYARMESLTAKYFDEYRFVVMNEIFFLSDVEILQYVEKMFRSGGDA